ncbi:glycosyltransferase [Flavobacterium silvisoli]|uniref:Glycosyltransferase n=1 Tax=Flavobacterium silvisoli TaxID=2529433 RepID=A0A4Q9YNQ2_9FLAO|nr:glycosyltransferase [Flavobacterium silvisoli]TBX64984.1 glycosyltransferase [Flavobacterium silvisoli]
MTKKRILFLGETYRADAITWMNGLKEFGDFEIVTWELQKSSVGFSRISRLMELLMAFFTIRKIAKTFQPDMVIAERTTSYGFLAALTGIRPIAIAQQGITDLWPHNSPLFIFKKMLQDYAFRKADLIHAWGEVMANHMEQSNVDMSKVLVLPKGINLSHFQFKDNQDKPLIDAIVTRALEPEYKHAKILKAFGILKKKNIPFRLTIIGDGSMRKTLEKLAIDLNIENEVLFKGKTPNEEVAQLLQESNFYISMPATEGVSASLFEAMASGCFPLVTDLPGNQSWIRNHENGILIPNGKFKILAEEIQYAFERNLWRKAVVERNRKFIEEHANYAINMKTIADAYHHLIMKSTK